MRTAGVGVWGAAGVCPEKGLEGPRGALVRGVVGFSGSGRELGRLWGPEGFERAEWALRRGTGRTEGFVRPLGLREGQGVPRKGVWGFAGLRRALEVARVGGEGEASRRGGE